MMAGASSLSLVRDELEATIQNAEHSLESFIEDRENGSHIQSCVDYLQQIRGTLNLIEVSGAELLAQEMLELATDIPEGASAEKDETLSALGNGLFVLNRYLEYLQLNRNEIPELLITVINELRSARKKAALPESHFFTVRLDSSIPQPDESAELSSQELGQSTRRLRQMYQVGLLGLIREENVYSSARLMSRALTRLYRLYGKQSFAKLLWVGSAALESFADAEMQVTKPRKMLFASVDRQIKRLQSPPEELAKIEPPKAILKELLYYIALATSKGSLASAVQKTFGLLPLPFNDHRLAEERSILAGPGNEVYRSVSSAIKEELATIKDMLDLLERGAGHTENDFSDMRDSLGRLANTLIVVGLLSAAKSLKAQQQVVVGWQQAGEVQDQEQLLKLADTVLYVESLVSSLESSMVKASRHDATPGSESSTMASTQLTEAKIVVVEESQAGLALAKRAITAFMESNWDKMHLGNLPATLDAVRGGLFFLGLERASAVLDACNRFIQERIMKGAEPPSTEMLETLADALTSLEYFLEGMESTQQAAQEVLELAETSLADLGYKTNYQTAPAS
ncbi:hypothetical protein KCG35_11140 [Zooshikella sp. WH53]|uniref:Scaffold protein FimL second domain-containing protein n=2 Tax=Zooshikella harenae TaxID=2827238 RepID=A0ABS5ZC94_9GAMM|nr:hypothetical protein [Zooshikella harenae]